MTKIIGGISDKEINADIKELTFFTDSQIASLDDTHPTHTHMDEAGFTAVPKSPSKMMVQRTYGVQLSMV